MSKSNAPQDVPCPRCGANNNPTVPRCWLCNHSLQNSTDVIEATLAEERPAFAPNESLYMALSAGTAVLVLVVGVGLSMAEPSQGFGFFILTAVPLLTSGCYLLGRRVSHAKITWKERFLSFWISIGVFFVSIIGLGIMFFVFMFALCALGGGGRIGGP